MLISRKQLLGLAVRMAHHSYQVRNCAALLKTDDEEIFMHKLLMTGAAALLLASCTWVQLTSAGAGVRLATPNEVTNCTRVGRTLVHTVSEVALIERGGDKQQTELVTLARNEGADLGGNVVVAESIIADGEQTFGVYRCP